MKQFSYCIKDKNGMHARPAGLLATFAKRFDSSIRVTANEKQADAKRLLSLMSLGAVCGTQLTFTIEGSDEELAAKQLLLFCNDGMKSASILEKGE